MAFKKPWGRTGGGRGTSLPGPQVGADGQEQDWVPVVDKNPFYRTIDIINGITHNRYQFKLVETKKDDAHANATDGKNIYLHLGVSVNVPIVDREDGLKGDKIVYRLACGHTKELKTEYGPDKWVPCFRCGAQQAYLVLHHELSHPLSGSFDTAWRAFEDALVADYLKLAPQLNPDSLGEFLHFVCNCFDDSRVNGWAEYVWPGAAAGLWERWFDICKKNGIERTTDDFVGYILALGVGAPVDPDSKFAALRDIIEWGMYRIRGVGPARGMSIVRVVMDRCIGAVLANLQPPPKQPPQPQPSPAGAGAAPILPGPPSNVPSAAALNPSAQAFAQAIQQLAKGAQSHDPKTAHSRPSPATVAADPRSRQIQAMIGQAMGQSLQNLQALDPTPGQPLDQDMDQAAQQIKDGLADRNGDSQLELDARASILFLNVGAGDISPEHYIRLDRDEQATVESLRSTFYKIIGRQKMARANEGQELDIPSAIQMLIETGVDEESPAAAASTTDIFKRLKSYQGFGYEILVDMSGSMLATFPAVERATRMLHAALDFPFVQGELWGFRGAMSVAGRPVDKDAFSGEVWLYRYAKACRGYIGQIKKQYGAKTAIFPVECNGITPMNSAVRVSVKHLMTQMPAGMAKQLFILTDGSPLQVKTNGRDLPTWLLRQWVRAAVDLGRRNGIYVYALIIGDAIDDDEAKKMFGPPKYWSRAPAAIMDGALGSTIRQAHEPEGLLRGSFHGIAHLDARGAKLRILNGQNAGLHTISQQLDGERVVLTHPLAPEDGLRYVISPEGEDVGQALFRLVRNNFTRYLKIHA